MSEDSELLGRFIAEGAQDAFAEIVRRHVDLVHSAAERQVSGDAHLAWDVTQAVFVALAHSAPQLARHPTLTGWLYTTTRFLAAKAVRARRRREAREHEAHIMNPSPPHDASEPEWTDLRQALDAAMHEIGPRDRDAILARFFENRPFAEIGTLCGVSENSARMRVERALEKLRVQLARRGIVSTASALGGVLAAQAVSAAPAGLATAAATAGAGAGGGTLAWALTKFMGTTKITVSTLTAAAVLTTGAYFGGRLQVDSTVAERDAELATLRATNQQLSTEVAKWKAHVTVPGGSPAAAQAAGRAADLARQGISRAGPTVGISARNSPSVNVVSEPAPTTPLAPASIESLRMLADLQSRKLVNAGMTFVSPAGKVSSAFSELFALTHQEQQGLQRTVDRARDQLAELERANSEVTRDAKGNVTISVNSFAQAGGAVYDELMKGFAEHLGADRNAVFLALGANQVERALGQFGTPQRTVTFSFDPSAPPDGRAYAVSAKNKLPKEESTTNGQFKTLRDALDSVGTVGRLVPPDFGASK